jgi:exopolysaccharide biosynthesis polyprenyl glycosylphosphotransferase
VEIVEEAPSTVSLIEDAGSSAGRPGDIEVLGEAQTRSTTPPVAARRTPSARPWPVRLAVITFAVDVLAITISTYLAKAVAHEIGWDSGKPIHLNWLIFATVTVWPLVFATYGLYDLRRPTHATAEFQRLFHALLMSLLLVLLITFMADINVSHGFIVWLFGFSLVSIITGRLATRGLTHALNAREITSQVTLIAGTNDEARALARTLLRRPWMGYRVCGFVELTPSGLKSMDGLPVFGTVEQIAEISAEQNVRSVIIAGSAAGGATLQLIDSALSSEVAVRVSPGLPNLGAARVILEPIDGMALFSLRRHRFSRRQRFIKRSLDLVVTSMALALTAPLMIGIAILVRMSSPGPILFRQRRVGEQERTFTILKFRSMIVGAHAQRDGLAAHNEADGLLFKMRRDPRVTRVGKFLRRTSLDELPQLLNVLRGDMSLVGPRPALPEEATLYSDSHRGRLRVKPGVTGLWQVNGRHDLGFEDYVRYDLFYVANWSLTMDLYILAKTIPALLRARGSY